MYPLAYRADMCLSLAFCTIGIGHFNARSQWANAQLPGRPYNIQQVYASTDGARVYYAGSIRLDSTNAWYNTNAVLRYSEGGWDTLGVIPNLVYTMVEYHDTLLAAGGDDLIPDSMISTEVVYWNGTQWQPYGELQEGVVRRLRVLNDTLYAIGGFDLADGQFARGIAKRVGATWQSVGQPIEDDDSFFVDMVKYQGHLVAIGTAEIDGGRCVYRLEGDTWTLLAGGVLGNLCSAKSIAVYNDVLYISGQMTMACGNAGQGIMRLVNDQWVPVGLGLQRNVGDNSNFSGATSLVVHDGLLWAGGYFRFAGGVEAKGLATWDGTEWCGVPGNFSDGFGHNGIMGMDFYHDTLFVSANMVDGDSVNFAAKFIGESYAGPCSSELQVVEQTTTSGYLIFPNPSTSSIRFTPPLAGKEPIMIVDVLGRVVVRLSGQVTDLDVSAWPRGVYTVLSGLGPPVRFVLQ